MAKRKNNIEKYLRGELTAAEMHVLEREALQDPFLAEALEGIDQAGHESFLFDLKKLNKTVHQRTRSRRKKTIALSNWQLGIAAAVILIAASSAYLISIINNDAKRPQLASNKEAAQKPEEQKKLADTDTSATENDNRLSLNSEAEAKPSATEPQGPKPSVLKPLQAPRAEQASAGNVALTDVEQADALDKERTKEAAAELTEESLAVVNDSLTVDPVAKKSADLASGVAAETASKAIQGQVQGLKITKSVSGNVTSAEDGSALPGVNVLVKGTRKGTVTDDEGHYEITLDDPKQNLVFSFIGLQNAEKQPGDAQKVDVQMAPDYSQLSEIVVTGSAENGQAKASDDEHPALQFAEPMGGRKAFQQYLENQMHYPAEAVKNKIEGRVTVQFEVNPNGELGDFKIIKGLGYGCDDEVIRLIKEGPAWAPTKRDDQPVKDKVKVRIKFDLPD